MWHYVMLFMFLTSLLSQAQVNRQEVVMDTNNNFNQIQTITPYQTKYLIKGGVCLPIFRQSSLTPPWLTFGTGTMIEYKLNQYLVLTSGLETNIGFTKKAQLYNLELPIGLRYYFSLNKRMKARGDFYSFFKPYISLQTQNILFSNFGYDNELGVPRSLLTYYRGQYLNNIINLGNINESFNFLEFVYLQFGYQFKIATSNYLDISIAIPFINYNKREYTISTPALVTLRYGIAWPK